MRIELVKGGTQKEVEDRTRIVATAGQISHSDKSLFDLYEARSDYNDNIKAIGRIVGSGHTSITEHDQLTFFITGVTPVIEQILIGQRLASFTIKSRRYVDFSESGFYTPDFSYLDNGAIVRDKYNEHMNYLFNVYSEMVNMGVLKEDARFILPYCFHSEITMSLNTRSLIKLIEYCTMGSMSVIDEVKEFGLKMLAISKEKVPYYKKNYDCIEKQICDGVKKYNKLEFLNRYCDGKYDILSNPKLIGIQSDFGDIDRTIIVSCIMNRYQLDLDEANDVYNKLSFDEKKNIMDNVCMSIENRELEQVSFRFEFSTSLAGLTHWTRQRMHALLIPDFLPIYDLNNYIVPDTIKEKCLDKYVDAVNRNIQVYNEFKKMGVFDKDLVYFNLSGTLINVSTNINGRELTWISRLRCCKRAQWEIRETACEMISLVKKESKLYGFYLGASCGVVGKCPEGKHSCGNPYIKGDSL